MAIVCGSEGNFNWGVADQREGGRARDYSQDGGNFEEFLGETEFENVKMLKMSLIGQISAWPLLAAVGRWTAAAVKPVMHS